MKRSLGWKPSPVCQLPYFHFRKLNFGGGNLAATSATVDFAQSHQVRNAIKLTRRMPLCGTMSVLLYSTFHCFLKRKERKDRTWQKSASSPAW